MEIKKHLTLTGSSLISWKDAIVKTVSEASKTLNYITNITVLEQRANVNENKIVEYFVDIDLTFIIDLGKAQE